MDFSLFAPQIHMLMLEPLHLLGLCAQCRATLLPAQAEKRRGNRGKSAAMAGWQEKRSHLIALCMNSMTLFWKIPSWGDLIWNERR
jgi:hypothetical protein